MGPKLLNCEVETTAIFLNGPWNIEEVDGSAACLRRFLPQTKAARLVAAFRLGAFVCKDTLTQEPFDSPERVYAAFGPQMRNFDREVLAVILLNTRFRLIKFEMISQGTLA